MTDHREADPTKNHPGAGEAITLFPDTDLAMRLSAFLGGNPEFAGRSEAAVKHILRLWLTEQGYDGAHTETGTPPDRLNASNDD